MLMIHLEIGLSFWSGYINVIRMRNKQLDMKMLTQSDGKKDA